MKNVQIKAFTLVELAIVLIIIGLITGGVVGAQSLINSAKMAAVISEFQSFDAAIKAFKLEYDSLPGDIDEASLYWSGEVNGNNDKRIFSYNTEGVRAWRHLALSGILPGNYDGTFNSISPADLRPNENHPESSVDGAVYQINWKQKTNRSGNSIYLVSLDILSLVDPKDARKIDLKLDDGHGSTGLLHGENAGCGSSGQEYYYDLDRGEKRCGLVYFLDSNN